MEQGTSPPDDESEDVRITLRLPRHLHIALLKEAEGKPRQSLNTEIVQRLNVSIDANSNIPQLLKTAQSLLNQARGLYITELKNNYMSLKIADQAWASIKAEGKDPFAHFGIPRPNEEWPEGFDKEIRKQK